ncbi:MAG: serine hydrolase [Thermoanaerobaculales bacterium]
MAPLGSEWAPVEALIRELMTKGGVPGAQMAIVRDGRIAWNRGFGMATVEAGKPVTVDTVFEAASLGKAVFAYTVMRLVERGEFDLDRPLSGYLPNPEVRDQERLRQVTARRVLCHTAGFPNWRRGKELTIDFDPGERFSYSGEGYVYLQKVIEAVTGLPLDTLVRREVFAALGMNASSFVWREAYEQTAATGYDYLGGVTKKVRPDAANAASSLHTTSGDFARFLAEILHPTLVKPATVAAMLKTQVSVAKGLDWGLGWGLELSAGRRLFWQWGDNETFRGIAVGDVAAGEALVLLTNSENGLSIAPPIVSAVIPAPHPAFAWLDVDAYDSPARTIRERLVRAGIANGERGVSRALSELEATFPKEAFSESLLNRIGYELLGKKHPEAASMVFEHNVRLFPKSWNVYDSLAEAYAAEGDLRLAITYYEKSLKLNPDNENAKSAIAQLKEARRR